VQKYLKMFCAPCKDEPYRFFLTHDDRYLCEDVEESDAERFVIGVSIDKGMCVFIRDVKILATKELRDSIPVGRRIWFETTFVSTDSKAGVKLNGELVLQLRSDMVASESLCLETPKGVLLAQEIKNFTDTKEYILPIPKQIVPQVVLPDVFGNIVDTAKYFSIPWEKNYALLYRNNEDRMLSSKHTKGLWYEANGLTFAEGSVFIIDPLRLERIPVSENTVVHSISETEKHIGFLTDEYDMWLHLKASSNPRAISAVKDLLASPDYEESCGSDIVFPEGITETSTLEEVVDEQKEPDVAETNDEAFEKASQKYQQKVKGDVDVVEPEILGDTEPESQSAGEGPVKDDWETCMGIVENGLDHLLLSFATSGDLSRGSVSEDSRERSEATSRAARLDRIFEATKKLIIEWVDKG